MNRFVLCGVAIFFAIVGIALVGGEEKASAGLFRNGCGGCGGADCGGGDCGAVADCCGRKRHRCHGRDRCHGRERCGGLFGKKRCCGDVPACCGEPAPCCEPAPTCCGEPAPACCAPAPTCAGEAAPAAPAEAPPAPPAPEKKA